MNAMTVRRLLYAFKRQWGTTFDYVQIVSSEADDRTGERTIIRDSFLLPAVLLPQNMVRKFIQDIGYLAADKNFTYGGLNDYNTITLLLDKADMARFKPNLNGYINHNGLRFERVSFLNLYGAAFLMVARGVEGANPYARLTNGAFSRLQIQGRATYELN